LKHVREAKKKKKTLKAKKTSNRTTHGYIAGPKNTKRKEKTKGAQTAKKSHQIPTVHIFQLRSETGVCCYAPTLVALSIPDPIPTANLLSLSSRVGNISKPERKIIASPCRARQRPALVYCPAAQFRNVSERHRVT